MPDSERAAILAPSRCDRPDRRRVHADGSAQAGHHRGRAPHHRAGASAVAGWPVVVVGSAEGVPEGDPVVSEEPPGGGPVAGIAAGWAALTTTWAYAAELGTRAPDVVVVLAGDLRF